MTVEEIRLAAKALLVCGPRDYGVAGISTDSRTVAPGDLFVAIPGDRFDGHDFIPQALSAGACGAIYSRDFPIEKGRATKVLLKVADTLAALGDLARAYRRNLAATVVGITGSNGKTTTKEMTRHILEDKLPTVASPSSFNNLIGLPLALFKTQGSTRVVVLEMGTNHPGEIARLADIARPDIAVITNIGRTHLEGLQSVEGVAAAKGELLHFLTPEGAAILNADDPLVMKMKPLVAAKVITFGRSKDADLCAGAVERSNGGFSFVINDAAKVRLNVPGAHNIHNALAAAAVARRLGLELAYIAERLAGFRLPAMRLQEHSYRGAVVINDAYNANPESMAAAIDELAARKAKRKLFVFADMLELGAKSEEFHRELGRRAAAAGFDFYLAVGGRARGAVDALRSEGVPPSKVEFFRSIDELGAALASKLQSGDVALVKGSRAMGLERVLEFLK